MKRLGFLLLPSLVVLGVIGTIFWAAPTFAGAPNSMTNIDYSGTPPFMANVVIPNILVVMDVSGGIRQRACKGSVGCTAFVAATTYTGLFDSLKCYTYDTTNTRFEVTATAKSATSPPVAGTCGSTEWDGNFLNWMSFRRADAIHKALIGGQCQGGRDANGLCIASGTPAKKTLRLMSIFPATGKGHEPAPDSSCAISGGTYPVNANGVPSADTTVYVCGTSTALTASSYVGRVPTGGASGTPTNVAQSKSQLFFHLRGGTTGMQGAFCVDDESTAPNPNATATQCNYNDSDLDYSTTGGAADGDAFVEQLFQLRVVVPYDAGGNPIEQTGTVQQFAGQARFGLMAAGNGLTGGRVLTPIGSRQSINMLTNTLETFNTNKAAMIDSVEESIGKGDTPLTHALYEAYRYIAQLPSQFSPAAYAYPIAFSPDGVNLGTPGKGSLGNVGTTELTVLSGSEPCPAGYIGTSTATCAAGRDPYFFGSDPLLAWASTSAVANCCKTFVLLFTDGVPHDDLGIPTAVTDAMETYGHATHGLHCTNGVTNSPASMIIHQPNGECNANPATPVDILIREHKTDYYDDFGVYTGSHWMDDLAYWAHTTDLRQATIPILNVAGHDIPGLQNVTTYTFFAFGGTDGRSLMLQIAKQGAFEDANGNNFPDNGSTSSPGPCDLVDLTKPCEWDRVISATGAAGRDNTPDAYFESNNADEIQAKLIATISSILQRTSSGSAVSIMASSSTGEGAVYQSYFFPNTYVTIGSSTSAVAWTGFTQSLFIDKFGNMREDYSASGCTGPPDGKLVLTHDCIIRVRLETDPTSPNYNSVVVDRFKDDGTASGSTAGDSIHDTTTPFETRALSAGGVSNVKPVWEGGRRLALLSPGATCEGSTTWPKSGNMSQGGNTCRRILTWEDLDNSGLVSGTETLEFSTANMATLCPYLGASLVLDCNSGVAANKTAAQNQATNIINWVRGSSVSGLRDRAFNVVNDSGATVQAQWKLGDVVDATPVVVGAPSTRYDVIYGDSTYAQFFRRYKDRRQVAYVGANDGMLHAFNAGFFSNDDRPIDGSGPTVQVRYMTTPKQLGTSTDCAALPCDASVTTYNFRSDAPLLGAELWAFIPQDLLPQLHWLTSANYTHMYYVDLTPKVTDARIFTADADHPGGWGTILIGGFRLGGSCTNCTSGKGTPRVVQADFNNNATTTDTGNGTSGSDYRVFLSSYFVLDVTNPEKEPTLLWVFRDQSLGLTTATPAVIRVNPLTDALTSSTNERWFAVFGTGPTHHDAFSTQNANIFAVDLKLGPAYGDINKTSGVSGGFTCSTSSPCIASNINVASGAVRVYQTLQTGAFMADAVTLDFNLDFRVDMVYAGSVICNGTTTSSGCGGSGPVWRGAMWRLTTNGGDTNPDAWGTNIGCAGFPRCPSKVISTFAYSTSQATTCANASPCNVGPITAAPTLTRDDTNNFWLFFGTGRFSANSDKSNVDIQHFLGVKDCIVTGGCTDETVEHNNLFNSSNVVTCSSCASGSNVSTTGSTSSFTIGFSAGGGNLLNNIQNMDGWFTTFNDPTNPLETPPRTAMTAGERNLSSSTLLGGTVFFTTFIPSTDMCQGTGTGQLYAVFYLTGGPYTASAIGTVTSGSNTLVKKSLSLGEGLPSQMQLHIGPELSTPTGPTTPGDCSGSRVMGITQMGTGADVGACVKPALSFYSRMVSWRDL